MTLEERIAQVILDEIKAQDGAAHIVEDEKDGLYHVSLDVYGIDMVQLAYRIEQELGLK